MPDHSLPAELARMGRAAIEQGIEKIQPGETMTLDLSKESIYVHLGPVGVNITSVVIERPVKK